MFWFRKNKTKVEEKEIRPYEKIYWYTPNELVKLCKKIKSNLNKFKRYPTDKNFHPEYYLWFDNEDVYCIADGTYKGFPTTNKIMKYGQISIGVFSKTIFDYEEKHHWSGKSFIHYIFQDIFGTFRPVFEENIPKSYLLYQKLKEDIIDSFSEVDFVYINCVSFNDLQRYFNGYPIFVTGN